VYLNCCSTLRTTVLQSMQVNVAKINSGRTSDVRVTVPEMLMSEPILLVLRSRILFGAGHVRIQILGSSVALYLWTAGMLSTPIQKSLYVLDSSRA